MPCAKPEPPRTSPSHIEPMALAIKGQDGARAAAAGPDRSGEGRFRRGVDRPSVDAGLPEIGEGGEGDRSLAAIIVRREERNARLRAWDRGGELRSEEVRDELGIAGRAILPADLRAGELVDVIGVAAIAEEMAADAAGALAGQGRDHAAVARPVAEQVDLLRAVDQRRREAVQRAQVRPGGDDRAGRG